MSDLATLANQPAIGIVVPPSNPTVEPEMARLIPTGARVHATRLPVMPDTTLEQRNRAYIETYKPALASFGSLQLQATTIGLTGPSYRLGPAEDAALAADLSRTAGSPVETASGAIRAALQALGAKRICLFSPYPPWLSEEATGYWRAAGHVVAEVVQVSESFRAYELTTQEVQEALARITAPNLDAVVMSGTGMITLPAISARGRGVPMLSSNICCAWWMMRMAGISPSAAFTAAAPELAKTLA